MDAQALATAVVHTDGFAARASGDVVQTIWNTQMLAFGMTAVPLFTVMVAFSLSILRSHLFAAWEGWLGIVLGAVALAGGVGITSPALGNVNFVSFLAFAVWAIVTSVLMIVRGTREAHAAAPMAAPVR